MHPISMLQFLLHPLSAVVLLGPLCWYCSTATGISWGPVQASKLDVSEVEGLSDLLAADTAAQHQQVWSLCLLKAELRLMCPVVSWLHRLAM